MTSIFDLEHKITLRNKKRVMSCLGHFCDIDGMSEYEYYKQKRATKEADGQ